MPCNAGLLGAGCFRVEVDSNVTGTQFQTGLVLQDAEPEPVPFGECTGTCTIIVPWNVDNKAGFTSANLEMQSCNVTLSFQTFSNTSTGTAPPENDGMSCLQSQVLSWHAAHGCHFS